MLRLPRGATKLRLFKTFSLLVALAQTLIACRPLPVFPSGSTEYRIELGSDGSAFWKITYSVRLLSEEDRMEFKLYAEDFNANLEAHLSEFRDAMVSVVAEMSNLAGRPMEAELFNATIGELLTPTGYLGVLTYSFIWKGFLECAGSSLYMGDVFEGGFYLYENETLVLVPPPGYRADYVYPPADFVNSILKWYGRRNFGNGEPAALFVSKSTSLSLSCSKEEAAEGDVMLLRGYITPPFPAKVVLMCRTPDGSVKNQTVFADDKGLFEVSLQLSKPGTWSVKAVFEGDEGHLASESQTITLKVNAKASAPLLSLSLMGLLVAASATTIMLHRKRAHPETPAMSVQGDREKLLSLLRSRGGVMYQRDISRSLGYSKSKTTSLLNALEREGLITREKHGNRKLVKLNSKTVLKRGLSAFSRPPARTLVSSGT